MILAGKKYKLFIKFVLKLTTYKLVVTIHKCFMFVPINPCCNEVTVNFKITTTYFALVHSAPNMT